MLASSTEISRKLCNKCKVSLSTASFYKDSSKEDKLRTVCKECTKSQLKTYYKKNTEKWTEYNIKKSSEYRKCITKLWQQRNKSKCAFYTSQRRALLLKATPSWLSEEHLNLILIEYDLAAWCTKVTQQKYEVDHIVPLQGKTVCGLHVPWNLQVLPKIDNIKKSNKY